MMDAPEKAETTSIGGLIKVDRSNWMGGQIGFVGSGTNLVAEFKGILEAC